MIVKMGEIIYFNIFYEEIRTLKIPLKLAFKLSNLAKAINEKVEFYQEELQKIFQEYGELDEKGKVVLTSDGRGIKVKKGTEEECLGKINELQSLEVELPNITFDIEEFGDIEMTVDVFNIITPFLS